MSGGYKSRKRKAKNENKDWPRATRLRDLRFSLSAFRFSLSRLSSAMHFDAHAPVIADLEARILTIRDSL
jgi:hypothetical protein